MREETFTFRSTDNMEISTFKWAPDEGQQRPRAIVQIAHGSVEHAARYSAFAERLTENGFIVYANDHRGHGKTARTLENLSYFSDEENGWELAVNDLYTLTQTARNASPGLPVFLLGHSMGSFLVRDYITRYGETVQGAILSGTAGGMTFLVKALKFISKQLLFFKGRKTPSPLLHKLIYGNLNDKIKNSKTDFDFLSRDESEVLKYIDDPFCGHTVTIEYAFQMACGMDYIYRAEAFSSTPKSLPIYLFSGEHDPVGGTNGKDVKKVYRNYQRAGVGDVTLKLYPGARHETLNEINREEVYNDIIMWMDRRIP